MDVKPWYLSKAVLGGVITLCSAFAGAFGIIIDMETQIELTDLALVFGGAVGGILAIYGRIKASKKVV